MSILDLGVPSGEIGNDDAVALLACQTRVLALMSKNATRQQLLDEITFALEELIPTSNCSLLLLDSAGTLRHGSAPTLPDSYLSAIDGLVPGEQVGSCGTAAFLGTAVIVEDIFADDRWIGYQDLAAAAGLHACWSTPVRGRSGQVVGTFAVYHRQAHNPTLRQQHIVERLTYLVSAVLEHASMMSELTESEERFRRAFEDNATAMGLLDRRGVFQRINTAMRVLVGDRLDPGFTRLVDIVVPENAADVSALLSEVRTGRRRQAQVETRVTDGHAERVVSLTMSLVRAADGEAYQVSVSMLDLTERLVARRERRARLDAELAQQGAEAASHAKSAFLAAVSHEMRTPLQAITGFAELLGTLELDADRRAEALRHITAGATHLLELVDDTLDLSRIEANALPLTMQGLDTGPLVAGVLDFLAPVAAQHGVKIRAGACVGTVLADERRLRQVLINLVSNGIRYSGPRGIVSVRATGFGDSVRITVADNGPGIAREVRARLFEPFVRSTVDQTGASRDEAAGSGVHGIGLGLMLASGLTEAMGGRLTIDDPHTGSGTVATILLPAAGTGDTTTPRTRSEGS